MPQVASDPVVSRPLRPESLSGRAGAPAGEPSGAFEGLLDAPAATRPRPAKNGQSADPGEPVKAAETVAEATPVPPADFAAIAEALTVLAPADAKPVEQMTEDAPVTPDQSEGSDDAAVVLAPDATLAPPPVAAIAIALAAPLPAMSAAAAVNGEVAGIAPVALQASAPAIPAVAANPEPPALPSPVAEASEPAAATAHVAAAAAATAAPVEKTAPPDDAQKAAALKGLPETGDKKDATAVHAESKTESGKAKADHPGAARAQPHLNATKSDAAPEPQPKAVPHQPRPEAAERASSSAHAGAADTRPELPVTAAPQAQIHAGGPLPFGLAVHAAIPLAALSPLTALRVDAPTDTAVPVAGLAVEIVSRAQDGLRRFEIRLDPPELGRIDVRLDVDTAGKVTSRLTVERAETLDLLRRDAPQLERALQHAGLNTEGGLEFSLRDQNFANREQARNPAATQLIVPDDEATAAEAARRGYGRMIGLGGGVDIRV